MRITNRVSLCWFGFSHMLFPVFFETHEPPCRVQPEPRLVPKPVLLRQPHVALARHPLALRQPNELAVVLVHEQLPQAVHMVTIDTHTQNNNNNNHNHNPLKKRQVKRHTCRIIIKSIRNNPPSSTMPHAHQTSSRSRSSSFLRRCSCSAK
jgi:hypothetical protein